jgi:surface antigen
VGFNETWCAWIKKVIENGTVVVKMNNTMSSYFLSHKTFSSKARNPSRMRILQGTS